MNYKTSCLETISTVWNKEDLPELWKEAVIVPLYKKGNKIDFSNYERHITSVSYIKYSIQHRFVRVNSLWRGNDWRSLSWILTEQLHY